MNPAVTRAWVAGVCLVVTGCGRQETAAPAAWQRCRQAQGLAAYDGAAVLDDGERSWIAGVDSPTAVVPRIALRHERWEAHLPAGAVLASLVGTNPSLVRLDQSTLGLAYRAVRRDGSCQYFFRRFDVPAARFGRAVQVTAAASMPLAGNARLLRTAAGTLLFPTVEFEQAGGLSTAGIVLCTSEDDGRHWQRRRLQLGRAALAPVIAETSTGALLLVANCLGMLHRAVSTDAGTTWTALAPIGIPAQESPHALWRLPDTAALLLVWTETQPHAREAPPPIRALRGALSVDTGQSWTAPRTLFVRPGWLPRAPALDTSTGDLHVALEASQADARLPLRRTLPREALGAGHAEAVPPLLPERGRDNLRVLVAHALARSDREAFLFVECYLMRALVAAHEALAPFAAEHADWLDTQSGLALARDYADELVRRQQPSGYWSIGYKSRFVADMAVAVGLFRSLAPHVDAARRQQYVAAATRFLAALERDGLLLANGAVGVGKSEGQQYVDRTPYTVATALAGAAARAWLGDETQLAPARQSSIASLRWLVAQIQADGSVPEYKNEPALVAAAYMTEAWMAVLPLLSAAEAHALVPALQRHLRWLLETQRQDGAWGTPGSAARARTPLLVQLLLWAEAQGLAPPGVQAAISRGLATLDFDVWRQDAVFAEGGEVQRALAGIPLATWVREATPRR